MLESSVLTRVHLDMHAQDLLSTAASSGHLDVLRFLLECKAHNLDDEIQVYTSNPLLSAACASVRKSEIVLSKPFCGYVRRYAGGTESAGGGACGRPAAFGLRGYSKWPSRRR